MKKKILKMSEEETQKLTRSDHTVKAFETVFNCLILIIFSVSALLFFWFILFFFFTKSIYLTQKIELFKELFPLIGQSWRTVLILFLLLFLRPIMKILENPEDLKGVLSALLKTIHIKIEGMERGKLSQFPTEKKLKKEKISITSKEVKKGKKKKKKKVTEIIKARRKK